MPSGDAPPKKVAHCSGLPFLPFSASCNHSLLWSQEHNSTVPGLKGKGSPGTTLSCKGRTQTTMGETVTAPSASKGPASLHGHIISTAEFSKPQISMTRLNGWKQSTQCFCRTLGSVHPANNGQYCERRKHTGICSCPVVYLGTWALEPCGQC